MQFLPLIAKVHMSQARIAEWYRHFDGNVCISFSGGKDSTVLASIVHEYYPDVPLVFCNTGLEYPEIQAFAKKMGAEFIRPKMSFSEVISTYGYPIISKENAEAIHYARKIRNGGGGATEERKRAELEGRRTAGTKSPSPSRGGVQRDSIQTSNVHRDTIPMYQGRTGWRRALLTGKPTTGGAYRTMLHGEYGRRKTGVAQIGINGEETASPG